MHLHKEITGQSISTAGIRSYFAIAALAIYLLISPSITGAQPAAEDIIKKSLEVYGGDDSVSKLTFSFRESNAPERKLIYTMLWKDYKGKEGLSTKMLFFQEFPPNGKGIAYMSWMYRPDLRQDDEEWVYLPELQTVRKLSRKIDQHHRHEDDEFAKSVLDRPHLVPRSAYLDNHKLVKTEEIAGKNYYVIERTPKEQDDDYPYSKTINWISQDSFLLTKLEYYDMDGKETLRQKTSWQKIGNAWVWDKVEGTDVKTGNTTVVSVSDTRVNIGINDDTFTKRVMKLGVESLRLPGLPSNQ